MNDLATLDGVQNIAGGLLRRGDPEVAFALHYVGLDRAGAYVGDIEGDRFMGGPLLETLQVVDLIGFRGGVSRSRPTAPQSHDRGDGDEMSTFPAP